MKRSSPTSLKAKPAAFRTAVSSTLRRQTSAGTMKRGPPSSGVDSRAVSSLVKRQTISSKPSTTVNKTGNSKPQPSKAPAGKGDNNYLNNNRDPLFKFISR